MLYAHYVIRNRGVLVTGLKIIFNGFQIEIEFCLFAPAYAFNSFTFYTAGFFGNHLP